MQLRHLISVLRRGKIWGLNVGELWHVSRAGWQEFADALPSTNVTHMYASEGTNLTAALKKQMMDAIRANRRTDKRHYNKNNRHVIDRVTNMWFNPHASLPKYQAQFSHKIRKKKLIVHGTNELLHKFPVGCICWARVRGSKFRPSIVCDKAHCLKTLSSTAKTVS